MVRPGPGPAPTDAPAPDLSIRPARPEDAEGILEIYAPIVRDTAISFELDLPDVETVRARIAEYSAVTPWLVATLPEAQPSGTAGPATPDPANIAGYAYATRFRAREAYRPTAEVSVYVSPRYHRRGLARRLYAKLFADLRARDHRMLIAGITLPNDASVRLHESIGFRPVGVFTAVGRKFDRWHDVGFWELDLHAR